MGFSWDDFVAGYIGGVAGLVVGHPADTVKVRQQVLGTKIIPTIVKTYKYEGIHGFYKGMLFPLLSTGVLNAVFFGFYGNCMRMFSKEDNGRINMQDPKYLSHVFYSGCIAGLAQVVVSCPIEVVKTTLQSQTEGSEKTWKKHYVAPYNGMWPCIKGIYKERGISGFYRGTAAMIIRDVPTFGLYTQCYEYMHRMSPMGGMNDMWKRIFAGGTADVIASATYMTVYKYIISHDKRGKASTVCVAGGIAGVLSWVFIIPFDVVKSRMQSDDPTNPRYKGMIDCFRQSYQSGGIKVFTRGFWVVSLRAFPVNAAVFVTYEVVLEWLQRLRLS